MEPLLVRIQDPEGRAPGRLAFLRSPVRIGRRADCDILLPHAFVSARHGLVQFDEREAHYTDLGSRNGSLLNGERLAADAPALVGPGCELRIGSVRLTFSRGAPASPEDGLPAAPLAAGSVTALLERLARTPDFDEGDAWARSHHPGLVLGRFELLRELGRGGFGIVYEARDRQLGRRVAVKLVRPGERQASPAGELLGEAEAAARLSHPHIVTLHDVGSWEGGPYLVLELLRGESLERRLQRAPLPAAEALAVAVDVARALAHAHAAGVIHRDLKPGNVFLTEEGFAKVLDFGLARVFGGRSPEGGTPRYMAPEQRRGEAVDGRADVWSAALTLLECLGGLGPEGRPRPEAAPEPLRPLLRAALAEGRELRPASGRAWLEELLAAQRLLEREP